MQPIYRFAILTCCIGLIFVTPAFAQDEKGSAKNSDSWVGKKVVPKIGAKIHGDMIVYRWTDLSFPLEVRSVKKNKLFVGYIGPQTWIASEDVILLREGMTYYRKHLEKNPKDALAWAVNAAIRLAIVGKKKKPFAQMERELFYYRESIKDCDRAIKLDPRCLMAYRVRAICHNRLGNRQSARHDFDKAIKIDPSYAPAYNLRAKLFSAQGDDEKALRDFRKALEIWPKASYYHNVGITLMEQDRIEEAEEHLKKSIALDREYAECHYALAYLNLEKKEKSDDSLGTAIKHFQLACQLTKFKNSDYLNGLVHAHERHGESDKAQKYRRMIHELRDDDDD